MKNESRKPSHVGPISGLKDAEWDGKILVWFEHKYGMIRFMSKKDHFGFCVKNLLLVVREEVENSGGIKSKC